MYIANTTRQRMLLHLRLPEVAHPIPFDIASGTQVEVGPAFIAPQVDYVIKQLETYGGRDVASLDAHALARFSGILYSVGKPVKSDRIREAHDHVLVAAQKRSRVELTRDALGLDAAVREKNPQKKRARRTRLQVSLAADPQTSEGKNPPTFSVDVDPDGHDAPELE